MNKKTPEVPESILKVFEELEKLHRTPLLSAIAVFLGVAAAAWLLKAPVIPSLTTGACLGEIMRHTTRDAIGPESDKLCKTIYGSVGSLNLQVLCSMADRGPGIHKKGVRIYLDYYHYVCDTQIADI